MTCRRAAPILLRSQRPALLPLSPATWWRSFRAHNERLSAVGRHDPRRVLLLSCLPFPVDCLLIVPLRRALRCPKARASTKRRRSRRPAVLPRARLVHVAPRITVTVIHLSFPVLVLVLVFCSLLLCFPYPSYAAPSFLLPCFLS
ncbi:hypothetical protein EXIGLDRAFT_198386 [Exidia glandulosa HHB12029]|uniref:Transmembrane protein n=1 Tax=Exidia glandulosa HHB12029 TaxID=1314781 RepID=A0A165MX71_EXIGL|nr:hypothetical protein EXIGLDRAFT_198386 [Exidia glandulosa HHB12029]